MLRIECGSSEEARCGQAFVVDSAGGLLGLIVPTPFLLIDGYNLLHATSVARHRYGPGDLERARHRLVALLAEKLSSVERQRCTVVFDALAAPAGVPRETTQAEITILFAPVGSDADTLLEQLLDRHPAPKQTLMISADHRLHKAARRRGATPIDSEPFWDELQKRPSVLGWGSGGPAKVGPEQESATARPVAPPLGPHADKTASSAGRGRSAADAAKPNRNAAVKPETAAWLKEFGAFSIQDLAAEVDAEEQTKPDPWKHYVADLEATLEDPRRREQWLKDDRRLK